MAADGVDAAVLADLRHLSLDDDEFWGHDSASSARRTLTSEERIALRNSFASARRKLLDEADEGVVARLGDGRFTKSFLGVFSSSFSFSSSFPSFFSFFSFTSFTSFSLVDRETIFISLSLSLSLSHTHLCSCIHAIKAHCIVCSTAADIFIATHH